MAEARGGSGGPLSTYRRMRRFDETPEPRGRRAARGGRLYVIQKHAARRLHYDFRLELDGVLKSWAVTRGPSLDPAQKRLAVRTEDHPVEYGAFEGIIPEGQYGGGTVMLWDRGSWEPIGDPHEGIERGKLAFRLFGERLRGRWALVRFKGGARGDGKRENWLLVKELDDEVDRERDILEAHDRSVATGRNLSAIAAGRKPTAKKAKARAKTTKPKAAKPTTAKPKTGTKVKDAAMPQAAAGTAKRPTGRETAAAKARDGVVAGVKLSHPEKLLYKDQGLSKLDMALYLEKVAPVMLPHVKDRLVSLVRCPDGSSGQCFFQRHIGAALPASFHQLEVKGGNASSEEYIYIRDTAGLVGAAQVGALELHIWGSHVDDVERPDRLVFDLDPGEGVDFAEVKRAAGDMRGTLAELGLESYPMLTGGKGVHVVVPMTRRHDWAVVKAFCRAVAGRLSDAAPDRFLATMSKAKRRGRIFIDYLRNDRTSTAIAPFSPRARAGAPVAWPVEWRDLPTFDAASMVTVGSVLAGERKPATWKGYGPRQQIKAGALQVLGVKAD